MRYKTIELDDRLGSFIRHMNAVEEYREVLQNLQSVWDNLTLLGQLSGTATDMSETRQAFHSLTGALLNQLGSETLKKCVLEISSKAQVAIDILVRNLFERTADIGFLATDEDIRDYIRNVAAEAGNIRSVRELSPQREALRRRFAEYVAKYSVYADIVLLDTSGTVLARLDDSIAADHCADPLVAEALTTSGAYVEAYRAIDIFPNAGKSLIYAYRVCEGDQPIGVLCLSFRFANEMAGIFANLATPDDWAILLLTDAQGQVVASSDHFHVPLGASVPLALGAEYRVMRFGAQEYIAVSRATHGYQGYMGPGWYGHVMLPVQHAFNAGSGEMLKGIPNEVLEVVMASPSLFGEALRSIPQQAETIQSDLNRSVWNGNVRQSSAKRALNPSFSKTLLWEISNTGNKTKDVFERSIANLHETVVSAILQESRFLSSLAIDIMDRNLYERANDCRWWALTSAFRELLAAGEVSDAARSRIGGILQYINSLYTVYTSLIVFDSSDRVVATSQAADAGLVGRVAGEEWVRRTLTLDNSQHYAVSAFAPSPLYGGRHTYIYGAAIHAPDSNRVVGGIGIVFDSAPQFAAMLQDALPHDESGRVIDGSFAVFADREGHIVACSDERYAPGARLAIDTALLNQAAGSSHAAIAAVDGRYYAIGSRMSAGYREYKGPGDSYRNPVSALVFVPLCDAVARRQRDEARRLAIRSDRGGEGETVEISTFSIGSSWFGIPSTQVVEAVDRTGLAGVPGAGCDFAGYLMYRGIPIPIFEIGAIANAGLPPANGRSQVIVLRRGENNYFGIQVDSLGEIPEIATTRLRPLPPMLAGGNVLGEAIVSTDAPKEEQLLLVLSVERIAGKLSLNNLEPPPGTIAISARRETVAA